ncbi:MULTISPECIES: hypothetical protein [Calothrix]|uniref:Uncharacterized protein n=2 Tax=Calothrix TaxID=1186 RepID=A0ABR8A8P5_9CYAN|nr:MULTISPECIES: hypothetical protein [Calothrix]MBD2196024.1 hypothetical protein [Calothrix parietina FACHB-288]MBD2224486.1 hypothetical protein [Calothrix anomala FACHB-343]
MPFISILTVNSQQSTVNSQQSTVNSQQIYLYLISNPKLKTALAEGKIKSSFS